jgi:hypothetical protein
MGPKTLYMFNLKNKKAVKGEFPQPPSIHLYLSNFYRMISLIAFFDPKNVIIGP